MRKAGPALGLVLALALVGAMSPARAQAPSPEAAASGPGFTPPTLERVEVGKAQFHRTCAQCHGRNMVNSGTTVYDLRRFPVDQPERFLHSVTMGKGNMPSFKEALSFEQIDYLWSYISTRGGKEL